MRLLILFCFILLACNSGNDKNIITDFDSSGLSTDTLANQVNRDTLGFTATPLEIKVRSLLEKNYNDEWIVVNDTISKWPKDMFDYFIAGKRKSDLNYPYIVTADLDANGKTDIAALVTNKDRSIAKIAIINDDSLIKFWEDDVRGAAISVHPKADIGDIYGNTARMVSEGINVEFFEKSSFVLYWNGKSFKKAWTGD